MKLKNMWKRFWTLDVHNHEGFTLVELIIVIAILAILSTGAIAGYSAYVESANKTADKALIAEIENVLLMACYTDDGTFKGTALLALSADGVAEAYDEFTAAALESAYGANWKQILKLKYSGWLSKNVEGSRFQGKETELLNRVDYLTTSLQAPLNAFVGENFQKFMDDNGIDSSDEKTVSNAAVLYVANNTANLSDDQQNQIINIFTGAMTSGGSKNVLADITNVCGGDMVTAAASMYAIAAAYSMHTGQEFEVEFTDNETPETAGAKIYNAFNKLAASDMDETRKYLEEGYVEQDLKAYMDILTTVNSAKGQVIGNLGSLGATAGGASWSNTYEGIFKGYNNGGVFVYLELDENGSPVAGNTLVEE